MTTKNLQYESGRSMVEMLGTLAIIGVLSVGGIAGYSYGMDKYRASTTLQDVNLRMVDIMTQVSQGRTEIAISKDWDEKTRSGYTIDLFENKDLEPSIMIESVPSSVCKLILKDSARAQDIFVGVKNGDNVDGNWYLGNNEDICDGGNKELLFALSPDMLAGFNPGNKEEDSEVTSTNIPQCYSNTDCSADKPYCSYGQCVECISNDDCGSNQYCSDANESCSEPHPKECKRASFDTLNVNGTIYYISDISLSWWDADAACRAIGRDGLISGGSLLENWVKIDNHNGLKKKVLAEKVYEFLGDYRVWTSDFYEPDPTQCNPYHIGLKNGDVTANGGKEGSSMYTIYAVCR